MTRLSDLDEITAKDLNGGDFMMVSHWTEKDGWVSKKMRVSQLAKWIRKKNKQKNTKSTATDCKEI